MNRDGVPTKQFYVRLTVYIHYDFQNISYNGSIVSVGRGGAMNRQLNFNETNYRHVVYSMTPQSIRFLFF